MAEFRFNGNSPKKINFKGLPVKQLNFGGTQVWREGRLFPVDSLIAWLGGSVVPAGWQHWTDAASFRLRGQGLHGITAGATGGSDVVPISGATGYAGAHSGVEAFIADGGRQSTGMTAAGGTTPGGNTHALTGDHLHFINEVSVTVNERRAQIPWLRKTGEEGPLPTGGAVLSAGVLDSLTAVSDYNGRLLAAASGLSPALAGVASTAFYIDRGLVSTYSGHWGHFLPQGPPDKGPDFGPAPVPHEYLVAPPHDHTIIGNVTHNALRVLMSLYRAVEDGIAVPGMVVGHLGSGPAPEGFAFCDGSSGTPDMRGRYVELSAPAAAGTHQGDGTATWSGSSSSDGRHNHKGDPVEPGTARKQTPGAGHGDDAGQHEHEFSGSVAYNPRWYGVRWIMCL